GRTYGRAMFAPYLAELLYGFNLKSPKFADPRFREAVSRAIDRDAIVGGVYQGTALPSTSLIPGGVPGHAALGACGSPCRHDVAAARALVATVFPPGPDGSPTVPTVFVDVDDDPTQQKVAEAVRSGLADAGIPAVLRPHPVGSYADFIAGDDKELFRLGWVAPFVSPDPFVSPLFTTASPFNFTRFSSGVVDAALASARSAGDSEQRTSAYQAAERAVLSSSSVAVVPIAQFQTYSVEGAAVHGLVVTTAGTFDASVVWLAPRGK